MVWMFILVVVVGLTCFKAWLSHSERIGHKNTQHLLSKEETKRLDLIVKALR